jgi:tRNA modification GTPase
LLNALVGREAAIATPIAGTTRDLIEVPVSIDGTPFLLIDSAGVRESDDAVEAIGVERARQAMASADLVLWLGPHSQAPLNAIVIHNFADVEPIAPPGTRMSISASRGDGLAELAALLVNEARALLPGESEVALLRRQRDALKICCGALLDIDRRDILLVAEALRSARNALDAVLGRSGGVDDMLDVLFGRFCIGK